MAKTTTKKPAATKAAKKPTSTSNKKKMFGWDGVNIVEVNDEREALNEVQLARLKQQLKAQEEKQG